MNPVSRRAWSKFLSLASIGVLASLLSCGGGDGTPATASPGTPDSPAPAPGISLLAGNIGGPGFVDGVGADARFEVLADPIAADPGGNVFVVDNKILRRIARDGTVTTVAGQRGSFARRDGKGAEASFSTISAMTADVAGNVYVIDSDSAFNGSGVVRRIAPDGTVTTLPNSDQIVFCERVTAPVGFKFPICAPSAQIAVDSVGNVYTVGTAGSGNNAVWKLAATGDVTQLAETAGALAIDRANNLYIANYTDHTVRKRTPDGVSKILANDPSISIATDVSAPTSTATSRASIALSGDRVLYVNEGFAVVRLDAITGFDAPLVGGGRFVGDPEQVGIVDGQRAAARLRGTPIAADGDGNVFQVGDVTVRKMTPGGTVFTFAGAGPLLRGYADAVGPAARFQNPVDLTPDAAGNLLVADTFAIRRIDPFGRVSTVAGGDAPGGSADGIGTQATFQDLAALRVGPSGTVYVLQGNHRLRRIASDGTVTTTILPTPPSAKCAADFVIDAQENLYFSCAVLIKMTPAGEISAPWNPGVDLGPVSPLSGALASVSAASNKIYHQPGRLAIDADGNLYGVGQIAGEPPIAGEPVMKFRRDGLVQPVPNSESANVRTGITLDLEGNIYVSELVANQGSSFVANPESAFESPGLIRKITPAGAVTVAGSAGTFGTVLGGLPGAITNPRAIRFVAPKTLFVAVSAGVLKIVVP